MFFPELFPELFSEPVLKDACMSVIRTRKA